MPEQIENKMVVNQYWDRRYTGKSVSSYFSYNEAIPKMKRCCDCCSDIPEGEQYYDFDGDIYCQDCIGGFVEEHKKVD